MSDWGGIFLKDGKIPLANYERKLVSLTTDGASVNTGRILGLMTRFVLGRDWLVQIHCINHRVKLAIKDALKRLSLRTSTNFIKVTSTF